MSVTPACLFCRPAKTAGQSQAEAELSISSISASSVYSYANLLAKKSASTDITASAGTSSSTASALTSSASSSSSSTYAGMQLNEDTATTQDSNSAESQFLNYMKESPGQRMIDEWLAAHKLTEKDLEQMSPEKQKAIRDQMAKDIEDETKRKAEQKVQLKTNILV